MLKENRLRVFFLFFGQVLILFIFFDFHELRFVGRVLSYYFAVQKTLYRIICFEAVEELFDFSFLRIFI